MKISFTRGKIFFYVRAISQNDQTYFTQELEPFITFCQREVHFRWRNLDFSLRQLLSDQNAANVCNHTLQEFSFYFRRLFGVFANIYSWTVVEV